MGAFVVTGKVGQTAGNKDICKHCGKYGHEEAGCYELIGYSLRKGSHGHAHGNHGGHTGCGGCTGLSYE